MKYEIVYNEVEDCSYVTVTGDLTVDDYKTVFLDAWGRNDYMRSKRAVWDFSGCRTYFDLKKEKLDDAVASGDAKRRAFAKMAMDAARELAQFTRDKRPPAVPPRIAVIAYNDIDFGTMRVYSGLTDLDAENLRVFKTVDSAREWLFGQAGG